MNAFIRNITITKDGSSSIFIPEWDESYHSKHGALQESNHVFIKNGVEFCIHQKKHTLLTILEMGFGTGLNCLLTYQAALNHGVHINYCAFELYPLSLEEVTMLNYTTIETLTPFETFFKKIHKTSWNESSQLNELFNLTKQLASFETVAAENEFDIIYFDVFGIRVQPELWTVQLFKKMYKALNNDGILVTYASNGAARRAMLEAGFRVEKIKGPPGKREMIRAYKN